MSTRNKHGQQDMAKMVRIDDDVHADLTKLGQKNESYSDVIKRIIQEVEECRKSKRDKK
jgi:predicted CopG family antitoxin